MIKFYAKNILGGSASSLVWVPCVLEAAFCFFVLPRVAWLGFLCGLGAFIAAFLGIEAVTRRIMAVGQIRAGVLDSLFWVGFKFLAPLGLVFYACVRGFSLLLVFLGLVVGLCNVSAVLFAMSRFNAKNY